VFGANKKSLERKEPNKTKLTYIFFWINKPAVKKYVIDNIYGGVVRMLVIDGIPVEK
jgi:hypothetical protein